MRAVLFAILLILCVRPGKTCTFTVSLYDTFGDGWNGSTLTVQVNGVNVLTNVTLSTGLGPATFTFIANNSDTITTIFNGSGLWESECNYTIVNDLGLPNFADGMNNTVPTGGTFAADCGPPPPPPTYDDPCTAQALTVGATCNYISYTTQWSTGSAVPYPSCSGNYMGGDVWFSAVVPASGRLTVDIAASGMLEGEIAIYSGPNCDTLTELHCTATSWNDPMPKVNVITADGLSGQAVWIRIWEPGNDNSGIFSICAYETPPPPPYDDPCTAQSLPVNDTCAYSTYTTNQALASNVPNPSCSWSYLGGDVWFTAVVPASGRLTVDIAALSMTEGEMAIYYGPDCNNLTELHCIATAWNNPMPSIEIQTIDSLAGQTVWIRIWEVNNDNPGDFNICAYETPPPPANTDPCNAINLSVDPSCVFSTFSNLYGELSSVPLPTCTGNTVIGDLWFTATVPSSGRLQVQTGPIDVTQGGLAIYNSTGCDSITAANEVSCTADGWTMPQALVLTTDSLAGQTVYIRFWWTTNSTVEGQFNICAFESPPMIEVNTNLYTPEEIVENVLVTGCLDAFNVSYCGDNTAIGYFTSGSIVGFENGVIMGSGPVNAISGADEGDYLAAPCTTEPGIYNDMSSISASNGGSTSIYDMNVLEFDFIPSSDTTIFKFVFASEEYDSYECTAYNDVFAFFVSGPGINGPYSDSAINVALIPGTAIPITVSTINNDPTCCNGCNTYYTDVVPSEQLWVQGKTTPLNAVMSGLIPCETYHIKLVVCDAGDGVLNTFVFLEGNSFTSTGDVSMNYFSATGINDHIYEGCQNFFVITRADTTDMSDSIQVALQLTGTANPAYDLPAFPFFLWIPPGQNSDTVWYSAISDGLTEGTEYVIISILNACNCTFIANDTIYINDNVALQPVIAGDSIICIGQASSLGVSVNQGIDVSLVSYAWSTGDTTDIITIYPVLTQSYNVTVSVPCYGDVILSRTVEVITELPTSIFAVMSSISCYGDTLDFIYTGSATPAANYLWNFDGGTVISGSGPGPISVSWTSQGNHVITLEVSENSCTSYPTSLAISYPPPLEINISTENIICPGGQPGQVNINVSGGTGPYVYSWSSGNGTNLQPGDYTVTVTDQPGCMEIVSFTIISPNPFVYTPAYFNPLCYGYYNGSITANLSGGTPPYTYQWSHDSLGALTAASSVTGLTAGVYYLTITDDSLCYMTDTFVLSQPAQLEANIASYNNVSCFGFNDGEATVEASGGTAGYTYLWNDSLNQITEHAVNLPAGDYVVEVTDANGCFNTALAIINEPPELFSTMSGMDITCNGMNDGTLTVIASGGVSPYHYYWSPWQPNSPNLAGLPAGIYFVTTADVNLCTTGNYFTISEPEPLCLSEVVTDATSYTGSDGAIDLTVTGGIPPYIYLWSTYETTQDVYNIPPGLYIVCVSDSNGCLVLDSVQVDYLNILDLQDRLTPEVYPNPAENIIIISNLSDSEIYLYDSSGKMVKHYLCRENKFIIDISGFPDGVYRIVVFGDTVQLSNGCLFPAYSLSVCKIGKK